MKEDRNLIIKEAGKFSIYANVRRRAKKSLSVVKKRKKRRRTRRRSVQSFTLIQRNYDFLIPATFSHSYSPKEGPTCRDVSDTSQGSTDIYMYVYVIYIYIYVYP
jgi:hypothetical protein